MWKNPNISAENILLSIWTITISHWGLKGERLSQENHHQHTRLPPTPLNVQLIYQSTQNTNYDLGT